MLTIKNLAATKWFLLPALLAFLAGCMPPGPRALLDGKQLLESGKSREAAERLRKATLLMPTNALAFNYLGLACHQAGRMVEAERAYERALALDRELAEVHFNLGCLFLDQNKLEHAKSEFTAYTLRRSQAPEGFLKLGIAQLRSRETTAAERSLSESLRLKPDDAEALNGVGLAKLQRNRAAEAAQWFHKALQVQPDYRPALLNLAVVAQEKLKDGALALKCYRQLLALDPPPDNVDVVKATVRDLEQQLAPPASLPSVAENPAPRPTPESNAPAPAAAAPTPQRNEVPAASPGKQLPPAPSVARSSPAPVTSKPSPSSESANRPTPSREAAKNVGAPPASPKTELRPAGASNHPLEVVTLSREPVIKTGQDPVITSRPGTKSSSNDLVAENQKSTSPAPPAKRSLFQKINPVRLFRSDSKAKPGDYSAATPVSPARPASPSVSADSPAEKAGGFAHYRYKNPVKPSPGDSAAARKPYLEGIQAQQSQKLAEAIEAYQRAIELDPAFFNAYYNMALAATASGEMKLALGTYETALALRPDSLDARYNFALVLKQAKYPFEAASELQKILTIAADDSRAHLALGNLYAQQLGEPALARQHYLKVLEIDPGNPQAAAIHFWLSGHRK